MYNNYTNYCGTFIPDSKEYHEALGYFWVIFVVVGSFTCILLYALFLEQLNFAINEVHATYRKYLIWIASVYPFMTLMSVIGFAVPRSQAVCTTVKIMYMTIGISNFADLTILLYGSEEVMLYVLRKSFFKLQNGPLCCCLFFLPNIPVTKKKLRTVIAGIYQLPFTQAFYLVMISILQSANQIVIGSMDPSGSYLWLNVFSIITSLAGVYCLNLLATVSKEHLRRYYYSRLAFVISALIIITKLQSIAFNAMAFYGVFPCIPPISPYVYKETVENFVYLIEMLIFGVYSYSIYRKCPLKSSNPTFVVTDSRGHLITEPVTHLKNISELIEDYGFGYPAQGIIDDGYSFDLSEFKLPREKKDSPATYDFTGNTLTIDSKH